MSVIDGKSKDWGSRSGKSKSKVKCKLSNYDRLKYLGLSSEILEFAKENPEEFMSDLMTITEERDELMIEAKKRSLKRVHKTSLGTLYNGDCIKLMENKIEDNSIDCIFADPPFNLSKNYGKGISDQIKEEEYLEWTRLWLDLCADKLKEGGSFFIYNIPKWSSYISHYLSQKLEFRHWIAVDIPLSMPIKNRLYPSHYSLLYFTKGKKINHFSPPRLALSTCNRCGKEQSDYGGYKKKMNPEGVSLKDVWLDIPPVRHKKYKNRDANELSVKLLDRVLDIATEKGDTVFDPFGGAGTTYAVAEATGRNWIGVELGDCAPIIDRLKNIDDDKVTIKKHRKNINTLFTDEDLKNRYKNNLPLDNFRVSEEQLKRAVPQFNLLQ